MVFMKSKYILLILTFVFCQSIVAQTGDNHGLILRGTAYDGTVEMHDDYAIWQVKLRMEFFNNGSKPIILINPFTEYGAWKSKVEFLPYGWNSKSKEQVFSKPIKKADAKTQRLVELAESLNSENPPQNFTTIIEAKDSLLFDDKIEVKQDILNFKDDKLRIRGYYFEGPNQSRISIYQTFKLKYTISLVQYQKNLDLLENLQAKWKSFGILPIDTDGGFSIVTEPIKNIKYKTIDKTVKRKEKI